MRVISGKYKRRLLKTLPGTDLTRPTSDRVKESLFNMLAPEIEGAIVWDLFAGSGSLGIESLSRGAAHVTFVEQSADALKMILENLKTLAIPKEHYTLIHGSVDDFLQTWTRTQTISSENSAGQVSVVLADPPYHSSWYDGALDRIALTNVCTAECLVVLEMKAGRVIASPDARRWQLEDRRKYGIAQLEFWRRNASEETS